MRLIDADALRLMKVEECAGHTIEYAAGWKACIEWIKTQPSAQPERKTGKWIDDNCSVCGQYVHHGDARNYCPRCGAKMENGDD